MNWYRDLESNVRNREVIGNTFMSCELVLMTKSNLRVKGN